MRYHLQLLGNTLTKFEFPAVISPVTLADNEKSDNFDITLHLDLTCDLSKKCLTMYSLRAFDCHLPTTAG